MVEPISGTVSFQIDKVLQVGSVSCAWFHSNSWRPAPYGNRAQARCGDVVVVWIDFFTSQYSWLIESLLQSTCRRMKHRS